MKDVQLEPELVGSVGLMRRVRPFVWGFASQAASSATSLGLSLTAALILGPAGLGTIYVGFSFYLLALGFQRALVVDPLVTASSTLVGEVRASATRAGLTMSLLWSVSATALALVLAWVLGGELADGLILFAPWLAVSLIQDFWRVILFRDGRERAAVVNDVVWAASMGLATPLAFTSRTAAVVVGVWGFGAFAGAVLGSFQTGLRPRALGPSMRWWRREAWPLGSWLSAESIVYSIGSQGLVFALVFVLGTAPLGGLRAVQTLFAPLTLLAPALALPGLPELTRQAARSIQRARRIALLIGASALALTGAYVLVASLAGQSALGVLFGEAFSRYAFLLWPVAIGQLAVASSLGFGLLLKAQRRGKALLGARLVGSVATFGLATFLATTNGVGGAAWGMAIGAATGAVIVSALAFVRPRSG